MAIRLLSSESISGSLTVSGTLGLSGTTAQYVRGDGAFTTLPLIPSDNVTGTGTAGRVAYWTSASNISSDGAFRFDGTNVAIGGAIVASRKLAIYNTNADNELEFIGTDYTNIYSQTDSTMAVAVTGDGSLQLATKGGNLTIVTGGSSTFSGSVSATGVIFANTTLEVLGQNLTHGASRIKICQENTNKSQIRYYGADASTKGSLEFMATTSDGSLSVTPLSIDSSGNVGIGTVTPSTKLEIFGNNSARNTLQNILAINGGTNSNNVYSGFGMGLVFSGRDYSNQPRDYAYIYGVQQASSTSTPGGDPGFTSQLTFYTNTGGAVNTLPTQKMVINALGNVGINVANPGFQAVDTYGQIGIEIKGGKENNQAPCIRLHETGSGKGSFELRSTRNILTSGNYFAIAEGTNTFFAIRGDDDGGGTSTRGYVGIGTVSPTQLLNVVNDTTGAWTAKFTNNTNNVYLSVNDANNYGIYVSGESKNYFSSKIGIGTTSPGYKLDVNGNIRSSTVTVYDGMGGTETGIGASSAGGNLRLYTGGTNKITVSNTAQSLILYGNSTTGSNYIQLNDSAGTSQGYVGYGSSGNNIFYFVQFKAAPFNFYLDGAVRGAISTAGTLTMQGDVIAYGSPSDRRLKENIKPIESALDKVSKLQGVTFDWKEKEKEYDQFGKPKKLQEWKNDIGFIAQDVEKVIPELVRENEDGMLSMRHQGIAPILLEAIKELKQEIEELKKHKCNCKE